MEWPDELPIVHLLKLTKWLVRSHSYIFWLVVNLEEDFWLWRWSCKNRSENLMSSLSLLFLPWFLDPNSEEGLLFSIKLVLARNERNERVPYVEGNWLLSIDCLCAGEATFCNAKVKSPSGLSIFDAISLENFQQDLVRVATCESIATGLSFITVGTFVLAMLGKSHWGEEGKKEKQTKEN